MQIKKRAISTFIKQNCLRACIILILTILSTGCASSKKVNYFQDNDEKNEVVLKETIVNYQPTIQYGDMLNINIVLGLEGWD